MIIKDTFNNIYNGINPILEANNFSCNKSKYEFKRLNGDCIQLIKFFFHKEDSKIYLRIEIIIKILIIDNIYKSFTNIIGRPYLTLGNDLLILKNKVDDFIYKKEATTYWLIENPNDIENTITNFKYYLFEIILPYFMENSKICRVDYLLNTHPEKMSIHNYLYPLRANIGIIAAKLNNNPNYNDLIKIYTRKLEKAEENYKNEFFKIINNI